MILSLLLLSGCDQRDNDNIFIGEWIYYPDYVNEEVQPRMFRIIITNSYVQLYAKDEETDFIWEPLTDANSYRISSEGDRIYLEKDDADYEERWFISEAEPNILYFEEIELLRVNSDEYLTHRVEIILRELEVMIDEETTYEGILIEDEVIGVWHYGFGESVFPLDGTEVEFFSNGTYQLNSSRSFRQITGQWQITDSGYLQVIEDNRAAQTTSEGEFTFSVEENQLTLTNQEGEERKWKREGTQTIDTDQAFLGFWHFGYGINTFQSSNTESFRHPGEVEFLPNGYGRITDVGVIQWRFIDDQLILERCGMPTFTVSVDDDMLIIVDEAGDARSWIRHGTEPEAYRDWRISDYLDYIVVDEGYRLINNFESSTASFDLVLYQMLSLDRDEFSFFQVYEYWEIVILQNGNLLDVIRHYPQSTGRFDLSYDTTTLSILEVDVDFDGQSDLLIWMGGFGIQGAGRFDAFLQRDDGFVRAASFSEIMNPMINHENQSISASWRDGAFYSGVSVYNFTEDFFVVDARLVRHRRFGHHRYSESLLVNGEWQISVLCIVNENEDIDPDYLTQCEAEWNEDLYRRIYDESGYWHFNNRGVILRELID